MLRCYSDLIQFDTLKERFEYLKLDGVVGEELFGYARYLNQGFYHGHFWTHEVRPYIILRDDGCDLGVPGCKIGGKIYVHHINPITLEQIKSDDPILYDPENLISCSFDTHQAITYGLDLVIPEPLVVRRPGDTCPWLKQ